MDVRLYGCMGVRVYGCMDAWLSRVRVRAHTLIHMHVLTHTPIAIKHTYHVQECKAVGAPQTAGNGS